MPRSWRFFPACLFQPCVDLGAIGNAPLDLHTGSACIPEVEIQCGRLSNFYNFHRLCAMRHMVFCFFCCMDACILLHMAPHWIRTQLDAWRIRRDGTSYGSCVHGFSFVLKDFRGFVGHLGQGLQPSPPWLCNLSCCQSILFSLLPPHINNTHHCAYVHILVL